MSLTHKAGWGMLAILCAWAFSHVVGLVNPQEKVNGLWLVVAAACFYVLAYRFYGRWLSRSVMNLDDQRRTPAHRLQDGTNFYPANKYILFGHHFAAIAGAAFALWLVQQEALNHPPDALWYVFLCGVIAICAMILPGISGSFILVILGKYHDVTGIIKSALHLDVTSRDVVTVIVFALGCAVGLIGFAKFLKWLLHRHHAVTMATLCGFMAGSLLKIWPFQRDLTPEIVELKHKRFALMNLAELPIDGRFWLTLVVAGLAVVLVLALDRLSGANSRSMTK